MDMVLFLLSSSSSVTIWEDLSSRVLILKSLFLRVLLSNEFIVQPMSIFKDVQSSMHIWCTALKDVSSCMLYRY